MHCIFSVFLYWPKKGKYLFTSGEGDRDTDLHLNNFWFLACCVTSSGDWIGGICFICNWLGYAGPTFWRPKQCWIFAPKSWVKKPASWGDGFLWFPEMMVGTFKILGYFRSFELWWNSMLHPDHVFCGGIHDHDASRIISRNCSFWVKWLVCVCVCVWVWLVKLL